MPSSIQYKKVYIDSKLRSSDRVSSSDFKYELPETITLPQDNAVVYLDDITLPHSWESILNINNKLYFKVYKLIPLPEVEYEFNSYY